MWHLPLALQCTRAYLETKEFKAKEAMRPDWHLREGCESLKAKLAC